MLDVGRSHRLVTDPIRLALSIRDGGCAFPGCTEPDYRCSAHHPVPWWQGGTTALNNLVLLCNLHHTTVEPPRLHPTLNGRVRDGTPTRRDDNRERWEVRINTNGLPEFLPPARLDPDRRPIPAHGTLPIAS
ncbi:HNH endonuclease [Tessaracoccus coleopterorum]|uniref:HNH endonuclease n=1 Tax=Tessaracoccus coleopterorum TaxID=2714950 RepID=UPI002F911297